MIVLFFVVLIAVFVIFILFFSSTSSGKQSEPLFNIEIKYVHLSKDEEAQFERSEYERWKNKANPVLDEFIRQYEVVINKSNRHSKQAIETARNSCEDLWYEYHATQEEIGTWVHSKEYMKSYLGYRYNPAMYNIEDFRKHLFYSAQVSILGDKKQKITDEIVSTVKKDGEIMRCKIHKMSLAGAEPIQVESCCRFLLEKNIIIEYKKNNRYYYKIK